MELDYGKRIRRDGAMIWTRYLMKSLSGDVRSLDRTLLLPTTDRSGVLSDRLAPHVFEEIHKRGKNPDGKYWVEFDDSGSKFNLFERACERVPKSRDWLLRDFIKYVQLDTPPILDSRARLLTFNNQRDLNFVPGRTVSALKYIDPMLHRYLEQQCMSSLAKAATPTTLIFLIAFLHEITWRRRHENESIQRVLNEALNEFLTSFATREFDDSNFLSESLRDPLQRAVANIVIWGDRCAPSVVPPALFDLSSLPFLMENSKEVRDACACLHAAGEENFECVGIKLPDRYRTGAHENEFPNRMSIEAALLVIKKSVLKVNLCIAEEYKDSLLMKPTAKDETRIQTANSRSRTPHVSRGGTLGGLSSREGSS